MKKRNETIRMLVLSAMFAALCCVTTMLVHPPATDERESLRFVEELVSLAH